MRATDRPVPVDELIFRAVDDGAVIVKPESGRNFALNRVGWALWQQIVAGCTVAELQSFLEQHFVVTREQAEADLTRFLTELGERELISWVKNRT